MATHGNQSVRQIGDIIEWQPKSRQGDLVSTKQEVSEILKLAANCSRQASLLVDLSQAESPNLEQKKIIIRAANKYTFTKVAVCGYDWRLKLAVDSVVSLIKTLTVQLFDNRELALEWLNK